MSTGSIYSALGSCASAKENDFLTGDQDFPLFPPQTYIERGPFKRSPMVFPVLLPEPDTKAAHQVHLTSSENRAKNGRAKTQSLIQTVFKLRELQYLSHEKGHNKVDKMTPPPL